jgi:hypothetical protein
LAKVSEYVCIELPWPVGVEVAVEAAIVLAGEGRSVVDGEDVAVPLAVPVAVPLPVSLVVAAAVPTPVPVAVGVPLVLGGYTEALGFPE